jgi:hypothetical protein
MWQLFLLYIVCICQFERSRELKDEVQIRTLLDYARSDKYNFVPLWQKKLKP